MDYKPHLLETFVEWFQTVANMLWPLRHAHPGAYLGEALCHAPLFGPQHKRRK